MECFVQCTRRPAEKVTIARCKSKYGESPCTTMIDNHNSFKAAFYLCISATAMNAASVAGNYDAHIVVYVHVLGNIPFVKTN